MISYLSDPKLKETIVGHALADQKADAYIGKTYGKMDGDTFKGCAVGCTLYSLTGDIGSNDHAAYEALIGVPEWAARLQETLFEGLWGNAQKEWPLKFFKAIPVGVDDTEWERCKWLIICDILDMQIGKHPGFPDVEAVLLNCKSLVLRASDGDTPSDSEFLAAAESARSAARSAAWSAAWSAAKSAAWSVAWSAAESVAKSAALSAKSAAESAAYRDMASRVLKRFSEMEAGV